MSTTPQLKRVCIVVLGDVGRSPRMCYHAASFHRHGYNVELVGYEGSEIACLAEPSDIMPNYVRATYVAPVPEWISGVKPGFIALGLKVLWQFMSLFWTLCVVLTRKPLVRAYFIQNPPGLPALAVAWTVARVQGAKMVVDWHNYSDSVLALRLGDDQKQSWPVKAARRFENGYGRRANANFCVSRAMARDLDVRRNVRGATVFYDRPPGPFHAARRQTLLDQHKLLMKLAVSYPPFSRPSGGTILTTVDPRTKAVTFRPGRPALIVSSTSWTADEDFGILLDALVGYNIIASEDEAGLPSLMAVVTGKGPQKEMYLERIQKLGLDHVQVVTPWLEAEDYPRFLALADLGVCLHTSTSGLDLPMKVVDMLGAGVPVLAKRYQCIDELVSEGVNGRLFDTSDELAGHLVNLLRRGQSHHQTGDGEEEQFSQDLAELRRFPVVESWNEAWDAEGSVGDVFRELLEE